jgi:fumarate hydratase subunit alpha
LRTIPEEVVADEVKKLVIRANTTLPDDVIDAIERAKVDEASPLGRRILGEILENAKIARETKIPLCQDTGAGIFFVDMGKDIRVDGGGLVSAVKRGMERGYEEGYFRSSMADPITRVNTGGNTPAIVHIEIVEGEKIKISFLPKGGGAENRSRLYMLSPSEGRERLISKVVETVSDAGGMACPPLVVGVGIGGTFDLAPMLAKRALLRRVGDVNRNEEVARLEEEILTKINDLGIGPMGMGGKTTALSVHIETHPCHISSLPLAVNLQCHSNRRAEIEI